MNESILKTKGFNLMYSKMHLYNIFLSIPKFSQRLYSYTLKTKTSPFLHEEQPKRRNLTNWTTHFQRAISSILWLEQVP